MEFLDRIILDNTLRSYFTALIIIAVVLLFKRLLSHSIASLVFLLLRKKWKSLDKREFISLTLKPLSWFIVITVTVLTLDKLNFPAAWQYTVHGISLNDVLEKAGTTFMIGSFFYFLVSMINFIALLLETNANAAKDKSHGQVITFFRDLLKVLVGVIGILFILKEAFNRDIGSLLTGLSIVGAALALAAKESIENLIASFIIFFDKPFFTGDTLKVNNVSGTVEKIGLRSTRIRTADKTLVTVPNKQMVDSIVDNLSMRSQRRAEIKLALSEKTKPDDIQKLIDDVRTELNKKGEEIIKNTVFLTDYGKEGATVTIEYFTHPFTKAEFDKLKQQVNFKLMRLMDEQKHEMSSSASQINIFHTDADNVPKQQPIV